jgi:hypothetical protein
LQPHVDGLVEFVICDAREERGEVGRDGGVGEGGGDGGGVVGDVGVPDLLYALGLQDEIYGEGGIVGLRRGVEYRGRRISLCRNSHL